MTVFKFYNSVGEQLKNIDWIEIQWNRKYLETGDFSLYTNVENWNTEIKYIKNVGRPETGIVQKLNYYKKENGTFVEVKGLFLEHLLSWGSYWLPSSLTGATTSADVKSLLEDYFLGTLGTTRYQNSVYPQLYAVTINDDSEIPSSMNVNIPLGETVETTLYNYLVPLGYSFYCTPVFNPVTSESLPHIGVDIHIYKLVDKTDTVYFGDYFKNVEDIQYTLDESDMYGEYVIVQEIPVEQAGNFQLATTINTADGLRSYMYINMNDVNNFPSGFGECVPLKCFETSISDIEFIAANEETIHKQMIQQATLDMLNHYKIENMTVDTLQNRFYYLTDYDLGDKCNLQITKLNQQFTARIAEVSEVHSKNKVDISLTMGTPRKTTYIKKL